MQGQWPRSHAVVTQLGECQTEDLEVAGSSPAHRTFYSPSHLIFQSLFLNIIKARQSFLSHVHELIHLSA